MVDGGEVMPFVKDSKELTYEIMLRVPKTMDESVLKATIEKMFGKHVSLWMFVYGFKVELTKGGKR